APPTRQEATDMAVSIAKPFEVHTGRPADYGEDFRVETFGTLPAALDAFDRLVVAIGDDEDEWIGMRLPIDAVLPTLDPDVEFARAAIENDSVVDADGRYYYFDPAADPTGVYVLPVTRV